MVEIAADDLLVRLGLGCDIDEIDSMWGATRGLVGRGVPLRAGRIWVPLRVR